MHGTMASTQLNWNLSNTVKPKPPGQEVPFFKQNNKGTLCKLTESQNLVPVLFIPFSHSIIPRQKKPENNCFCSCKIMLTIRLQFLLSDVLVSRLQCILDKERENKQTSKSYCKTSRCERTHHGSERRISRYKQIWLKHKKSTGVLNSCNNQHWSSTCKWIKQN